MNAFELAKKNFTNGFWTQDMLKKLAEKGKLTEKQVADIIKEKGA